MHQRRVERKPAKPWKMLEKVPTVLHLLLVMIVKMRQLNVVGKLLRKQLPITPVILPSKKKGRIEDPEGS
jgi:hypothetical protein